MTSDVASFDVALRAEHIGRMDFMTARKTKPGTSEPHAARDQTACMTIVDQAAVVSDE